MKYLINFNESLNHLSSVREVIENCKDILLQIGEVSDKDITKTFVVNKWFSSIDVVSDEEIRWVSIILRNDDLFSEIENLNPILESLKRYLESESLFVTMIKHKSVITIVGNCNNIEYEVDGF